MRKKDTFIGLTKKEDIEYIRCLCEAIHSPQFDNLTEKQQNVIAGSLKFLVYDNLEFIPNTLDVVNSVLVKLGITPPILHIGKDSGSGSWYKIPSGNIEERRKKLLKRLIFRRRAYEDAYFRITGETWEWKTEEDKKRGKERLNSALRSYSDEIKEDVDPDSAVVIPFRRD